MWWCRVKDAVAFCGRLKSRGAVADIGKTGSEATPCLPTIGLARVCRAGIVLAGVRVKVKLAALALTEVALPGCIASVQGRVFVPSEILVRWLRRRRISRNRQGHHKGHYQQQTNRAFHYASSLQVVR